MEEKQSNHKKKGILIVLIVCVLVLLGVGGYMLIKNLGINSADNTNKQVQASYAPSLAATVPDSGQTPAATGAAGTATPTTVPASAAVGDSTIRIETVVNPVDFQGLMQQNPDVYSWLYIPDTNISLPVLQSSENDNFYLDHDVYKNYSFPGAIYSQSMNNREYTDRVTVLYGHNMANGSMFADLHLFSDDSFFSSHPYFYVFTKDRKLTYQVVSAHGFDSRHIMNSYNFKDDAVFQSWLDNAMNPRSTYGNVRSGVTLNLNSKMLVLSTCENSGDGRFLLQGVLVSDEKTK